MFFEVKSLEGRPGHKRRFHLHIIQVDITGLLSENGCLLAYIFIITVRKIAANALHKYQARSLGT